VKNWLADLQVPLLVVHSVDDPVLPVSEMDDLAEMEKQNPNLKVWIMPAGMHCVYPYLDWNWFKTVTRGFFDYWAQWDQE
jgi:predicted alpha/beta-fold hydrolase